MKNRKARDSFIFSQIRFHFLKTMGGEISTSYSASGVINGDQIKENKSKSYKLVSLSYSFSFLHVVDTELLNWP